MQTHFISFFFEIGGKIICFFYDDNAYIWFHDVNNTKFEEFQRFKSLSEEILLKFITYKIIKLNKQHFYADKKFNKNNNFLI